MKTLKNACLLILIILVNTSLTCGLELTASTGSNGGSSSTHIVYGATVDDYANEQIKLNPEEGTLSNSFSGTGDLPDGSMTKSDSNGNSATVWRSVNGKPAYTKWTYDWGTSADYGVSAWLSMDVQNAYKINGGSKASNREGDYAINELSVSSPEPTASVGNYYTSAEATLTKAVARFESLSATGAEEIHLKATASNREQDVAYVFADVWDGESSGYSDKSLDAALVLDDRTNRAEADYNGATAAQKVQSASGGKIRLGSEGYNGEQDGAGSSAEIHNGRIYSDSANFAYYTKSTSGLSSATSKQELAKFATGDGVGFYGGANNKGGNSLQFQIATGKGVLAKGSMEGYSNSAKATSSKLSGKQHAYVVEGDWYTQDCGLSYSTRNSAGSFGWGQGTILNYNGESEAKRVEKRSLARADTVSGNAIFATNAYADFNLPEVMMTSVSTELKNGDLNGYSNSANSYGTLKLEGSQAFKSASGDLITANSCAVSFDEKASTLTKVIDGEITKYSDNAKATPSSESELAKAGSSVDSAYGKIAKIEAHVENKAPASEGDIIYTGAGDFGVQKNENNILSGSITSTADISMVYLNPIIYNVPFYKTAYILDPWRNQWTIDLGGADQATLIPKFMDDEFAVTYYRDSAVTRERVYAMDDYWVSLVSAHAGNDGFAITRGDGELISAHDLKTQFTKSNGLTIFNGCSTFGPTSSGSRPLYDALNGNSFVAGGHERALLIGPPFGQSFIVKFFEIMTDFSKPQDERTARAANDQAYAWVKSNNPGWVEEAYPILKLLPSDHDLVFI